MKNLIIAALLFIRLGSFAQTSGIFPDSIAYWREGLVSGDADGGLLLFNDYVMQGDTVVNGQSCKNLYHNRVAIKNYKGSFSSHSWQPYKQNDYYGLSNKIGVLRKEDSKLFIRFESNPVYKWEFAVEDSILTSGKEYLVFDNNWKKGDTIFSEHYKPGNFRFLVVKNQMKVLRPSVSADSLEVLTFYGKEPAGLAFDIFDSTLFIKGMGFNSSFFFRLMDFDTASVVNIVAGGIWGVTPFCGNGKLRYYRNEFSGEAFDCASIPTKISVGIKDIKTVSINGYPNPVIDNITFSGIEGNIHAVRVQNTLGQSNTVAYTVDNASLTVLTDGLAQGVYLIRIETDKTTYLCKISKQ